jgi:hypothetical protein
LLNVVVEWLTLLLRILRVLGSNLGTETGYPELRFFIVFLSPSRKIPGLYLKIRPRPLSSTPFPIHYSPVILLLGAI